MIFVVLYWFYSLANLLALIFFFPFQLMNDVAEWSSVLEVRDIIAEDFANFTCTATNSLGSLDIPLSLHQHTRNGAPLVLNVRSLRRSPYIVFM